MRVRIMLWQLLIPVFMPEIMLVGAAEEEQADFSKCKLGNISGLIPSTHWNPCYRCVCITRSDNTTDCRIDRLTCPVLECNLREYRRGKCCQVCKGCYVNGKRFNHNVNWTDMTDPCKRYICKEGVVTVYKRKCQVNCTNPIKIPGECCPSCRGCMFRGRVMLDGTTLNDPLDPCLACSCKNGNLTCAFEQCPLLPCILKSTKPSNKCCRQCTEYPTNRVYLRKGMCQINGKKIANGKRLKLSSCTSCACQDDTALCSVEVCPGNPGCSKSELVYTGRSCCPECRSKVKCIYMGRTYPNGATWYLQGCVECKCRDGRNYCRRQVCRKRPSCPKGTMLGYQPGSCCKSCILAGSSCSAFGDPHYKTFDGKFYSFQGTCKYILAKDCGNEKFTVIVKNTDRFTNRFAWTKAVIFKVGNYTVTLQQKLKVKINGKKIHIPFLDFPTLNVRKDERYIKVYTNIGVSIVWDGFGYVSVQVNKNYERKTCGLCGNYNNDPYDDLELPNGVISTAADKFANGWRVNVQRGSCEPRVILPRSPLSVCPRWKMYLAQKQCAALRHPTARRCHRFVNVKKYFRSCTMDVCQCSKGSKCECGAIKAFMSECRRRTKRAVYLRKERQCDMQCIGGSFYSDCGPGCKLTCSNIRTRRPCKRPCVSGCHCPAGLVWLGHRCVLPYMCPR